MKRVVRYPAYIYNGISSDPDTWGMCCSEEMVRKCAESNYRLRIEQRRNKLINTIKDVSISICLIIGIVVAVCLLV